MAHVVLVGFMGTGKTTVGVELAKRMELTQFDLDDLIEAKLGETIKTFFAREGEAKFREIETEVLDEYLDNEGILSTGGGVVMKDLNRELLKETQTPVVYLRTQPNKIMDRLSGETDGRPVLKNMTSKRFNDLWQFRAPLYEEVSDIVIDTDQLTPKELSYEIMRMIGERRTK